MGNTFWTLLYFSTFILSSGLMLSMFDAWIQGNFIVAQKQQAEQERLTVNALFKVRTRNRFLLLTCAIKGHFTSERQTQTVNRLQYIISQTFQDFTNTDSTPTNANSSTLGNTLIRQNPTNMSEVNCWHLSVQCELALKQTTQNSLKTPWQPQPLTMLSFAQGRTTHNFIIR